MASNTTALATTAERAELKCNSISRQFVHSNVVVISPSNGNPQRSQNGGRMKRTCDSIVGRQDHHPSLRAPFYKAGRFRIKQAETRV